MGPFWLCSSTSLLSKPARGPSLLPIAAATPKRAGDSAWAPNPLCLLRPVVQKPTSPVHPPPHPPPRQGADRLRPCLFPPPPRYQNKKFKPKFKRPISYKLLLIPGNPLARSPPDPCRALIDYIRANSPAHLYATAMSPPAVEMVISALHIMQVSQFA